MPADKKIKEKDLPRTPEKEHTRQPEEFIEEKSNTKNTELPEQFSEQDNDRAAPAKENEDRS